MTPEREAAIQKLEQILSLIGEADVNRDDWAVALGKANARAIIILLREQA